MKTSETDPLFVNELSVGQGVLGLTFCPGKQDTGMDGTQWHRDLHADLQALAEWGAIHVVSIIQHDELEILGVPQLGVEVRARGMHWHHLPVLDQSIPNRDNFPQLWVNLTKVLQSELAVGKKVVFHCRGGLGRTGLVAALLLMDLGSSARDAIAAVQAARSPRAIETREQEEYVRRYKPYLSHASLLGGAIDDSLGADIEFMNLDEIRAAFPDGVNRLSGDQVGKPGWFTDDTQMTLFTAEGLVLYHALQSVNGYASCPQVVHQALRRWLATQDEQPVLQATTASGLISDPRIWYQAAPGMTCLQALRIGSPPTTPARDAARSCG
jgi:ADP-ribosyl-[dinitrogen reductase] hydrolase